MACSKVRHRTANAGEMVGGRATTGATIAARHLLDSLPLPPRRLVRREFDFNAETFKFQVCPLDQDEVALAAPLYERGDPQRG